MKEVKNIMKQAKTNKTLIMILLCLFVVLISVSSASAASTVYVNATGGNDSNNGTIDHPYQTIGQGINSVTENGTIYLANGTYNESNIALDKNMNIIGESQSGTIINGQKSGNSIFTIPSGVTVTIINLTLTNGTTTHYGGAIDNCGNLTVDNITFTGNTADVYGGAISTAGGSLTVDNSTFTNNIAGVDGGAIDNIGNLTVNNSTFTSNNAYLGGAIDNYEGSLTVDNSTFTSNTAYIGGAIYNGGNLTVENSTFTSNTADQDAGAIYNDDGSLTVDNSTFTSNTATVGFGGAIYNMYSYDVFVSFCRIVNNGSNEIYYHSGSVDARYNWWGSNDDPSTRVSNGVDVSPWLVLTVTSDNSPILVGGNSTVTAELQHDSNRTYHDPAKEGHVPDGTPVTFNLSNTSLGSLSTASTTLTNGTATTKFTAINSGSENVTATVDNQPESTLIIINKLDTTLIVGNVTGVNGQNVNLTTTLTDSNGVPIVGQTVTFNVNGTDYTTTTNSNGIATYEYTITQTAGTYAIIANFTNSTVYANSTGTGNLTVNPTANIYINTTTSNQNPKVGDTFSITYKLSNSGPDNATPVTISFQIPSGLEFVTASVDNGTWTYNAANRTITWNLTNVAVGDPYLYLTVKALGSGSYIIAPTITSETFNQNTNPLTPFTVNIQKPNNNNNPSENNTGNNTTNTVNAATQTIAMQPTGMPIAGLVLAILTIFGGMLPRRKQ